MKPLYITSITEKAGKTMLCAGLSKMWQEGGKRTGYLKAISNDQTETDRDILFMRNILNLSESGETALPVSDNQDELKQAYSSAARDKDIMIIDGMLLKASSSIPEALDARVLVVHDYSVPLTVSLAEYKKLGTRLLGVVVNKAPKSKAGALRDRIAGELTQADINLLGVIPEDRVLMAMSIADLSEAIQGKILSSPDKSSELIENIMTGSSTFDRGAAYYTRKNNKAVILWGERPGFRKAALANLQTAALQTSTRCIVISHNGAPIPAVIQKADEKQVPLISAPGSIPDIVTALEAGFKGLKFNQEKKIPRLSEILNQNFNFPLLSQGLGAGE